MHFRLHLPPISNWIIPIQAHHLRLPLKALSLRFFVFFLSTERWEGSKCMIIYSYVFCFFSTSSGKRQKDDTITYHFIIQQSDKNGINQFPSCTVKNRFIISPYSLLRRSKTDCIFRRALMCDHDQNHFRASNHFLPDLKRNKTTTLESILGHFFSFDSLIDDYHGLYLWIQKRE